MKKGLIVLIVVAGIALALFAWVKGAYNSMVTAEENVSSAWSQVVSFQFGVVEHE